jgi:hypothetical protein
MTDVKASLRLDPSVYKALKVMAKHDKRTFQDYAGIVLNKHAEKHAPELLDQMLKDNVK